MSFYYNSSSYEKMNILMSKVSTLALEAEIIERVNMTFDDNTNLEASFYGYSALLLGEVTIDEQQVIFSYDARAERKDIARYNGRVFSLIFENLQSAKK